MTKFLKNVFLLFSWIILMNGFAYAERHCTREVSTAGGTKTITVECSASYNKTRNPDIIRNPSDLKEKQDEFLGSVKERLEDSRSRTTDRSSIQVDSDQKISDIRDKEQEVIDEVRMKQQEQHEKLQNSKR